MTFNQQIITIFIAAFATLLTRFLPFMIFKNRQIPKLVTYIGDALPSAILGILVIYCYKDYLLSLDKQTIIAITCGLITVIIHLWKKNMLLSMSVGTILYIILVNII
ncbi:branched-chain amino acid transporter permease [Fructilactobacillus sp. Tb1]|uniref:branched-chain amino acid transporter permease n=1 Tax=Fructilactobacillus sp. Tb1 TaxID=3422304 RepID=UPI003D2D5291